MGVYVQTQMAGVLVLACDLVQHVAPLFWSGHWQNYFLQLGQVVWASAQSIFLDVYGTGREISPFMKLF